MSTVTLERHRSGSLRLVPDAPAPVRREPARAPETFDLRPEPAGGGRLTLEQRLDGVWEGLLAAGAAECPLCTERMGVRQDGVAECRSCASTLR